MPTEPLSVEQCDKEASELIARLTKQYRLPEYQQGRLPDDEVRYGYVNPDGPAAVALIADLQAELAAARATIQADRVNERGEIVAWLRDVLTMDKCCAATLRQCAVAIERGEHIVRPFPTPTETDIAGE